jgi:Short C-terminal domain
VIRRMGRPGLIGLAARTAVVAGTATAVSGGMMASRQRREQEQQQAEQFQASQQQAQVEQAAQQAVAAQQPAAPAAASGVDVVGQLQNLAALHQSGALSDGEFEAAKQKLLGL